MITKTDLNNAWEMKQKFDVLYEKGVLSFESERGIQLNTDGFLQALKVVAGKEKEVEKVHRKDGKYSYKLQCKIDDEITVFTLLNEKELEVYDQFGIYGLSEWYYGEEE